MNVCVAAKDTMIVAESIEPLLFDKTFLRDRVRFRRLEDGSSERLEARGCCVSLYRSDILATIYTTDFPVADAFWCEFPAVGKRSREAPSIRGVCLVGEQSLQICPHSDAHSYTVTLPFRVNKVFTSPLGLIIQKSDAPCASSAQPSVFPHLFSLCHPYSEIFPVVYKVKDSESSCQYAWNASEVSVLAAFDGCQLLLCYSNATHAHSLCSLRAASKAEWKLAAANAETRVSTNQTPSFLGVAKLTPTLGIYSGNRGAQPLIMEKVGEWTTPQLRSVRTRSMTAAAALIHSLPFPTATPSQKGSSRSTRDRSFGRLRSGGPAHVTPRINSFCTSTAASAVDMRGAEIDMLAPEICIECVWTEPVRRHQETVCNAPANRAFVTRDFIGQLFACFFSEEQHVLKCIRIKPHEAECITTGALTSIACLSVANIQGRDLMAVVEGDGSTVLYSGVLRLGALYAQHLPAERQFFTFSGSTPESSSGGVSKCAPVISVHSSCKGYFILEARDNTLAHCRVAPSTSSSFVGECLAEVCSMLPIDKALKLSSSWCLGNHWRLLSHCHCNTVVAELSLLLQFVFAQCGLTLHEFSAFKEIDHLRRSCEESVSDKKRKRAAALDRSLAWEYLLSSNASCRKAVGLPAATIDTPTCVNASLTEDAPLHSYALAAFAALHICYENAKMDVRCAALLTTIASSLHAFASVFSLSAYVSYYVLDFPDLAKCTFSLSNETMNSSSSAPLITSRFSSERVPSFMQSIIRICDLDSPLCTLISSNCTLTSILVSIAVGLARIQSVADLQRAIGKNWDKKLGLSSADAVRLGKIFAESTTSVMRKCEKCATLFKLTREKLLDLRPSVPLILCEMLYSTSSKSLSFLSPPPPVSERRPLPSEEDLERTIRLRWRDDLRVENARQMLDSHRPVFIPSNNEGAMASLTESDLREAQEQLLYAVCTRTMAQCFGLAAAELRSVSPLLNRPLEVPQLCLQGRLFPSNTPFEITQSESSKAMTDWGAFYNGVAAGLRLGDATNLHLDCEWLSTSATIQRGPMSAGLMYAFGLNGHIDTMNLFTVHELLSSGDRLMSVAILLGCAVCKRASADIQMYKMMVTHLPFLMGPTLLELHIEPMIQTAALVSLGLLFAGSSHLGILAQLINEIGRPTSPDHEPSTDRYAYSLSAGFAIGLIALGKGDEMSRGAPFVERFPSLASRLVVLLEGGPRALCVFPTTTPSEILQQGVNAVQPPQQSNHAKESDNVNPHLSASAATVALGLMYLRTGNAWAAKCLQIPDTISQIEMIRPDILLSRTLSRSLVLWEEISASREWVQRAVPQIVLLYKKRLFDETPDADDYPLGAVVDGETIAQTYLYIVAGACFAIALRFASSSNAAAFETIMHYTMLVLPMAQRSEAQKQLCEAAGRITCVAVLNSLLYSLGVLMAGSGNLQVLRLCRFLRSRVAPANARDATTYSTQVAAHITIGLVLLGRARYALSTSDLSIAALVIAFFPVCPHSITDNRMYLQPLRYLWTIAAEERLLCPVDAVYLNQVVVNAHFTFKATSVTVRDSDVLRTPCIVPELKHLEKVRIEGANYETRTFDMRVARDVAALTEILGAQHGRVALNPSGRKGLDGFNRGRKGEPLDEGVDEVNDEELLPLSEELASTLRAFDFAEPMDVPEEFSKSRFEWSPACADAYEAHIRYFQLSHRSLAAHDFLFSFVKDVVECERLRLPECQLREVCALLDAYAQLHPTVCTPSVIASEIVRCLRCHPKYAHLKI